MGGSDGRTAHYAVADELSCSCGGKRLPTQHHQCPIHSSSLIGYLAGGGGGVTVCRH